MNLSALVLSSLGRKTLTSGACPKLSEAWLIAPIYGDVRRACKPAHFPPWSLTTVRHFASNYRRRAEEAESRSASLEASVRLAEREAEQYRVQHRLQLLEAKEEVRVQQERLIDEAIQQRSRHGTT